MDERMVHFPDLLQKCQYLRLQPQSQGICRRVIHNMVNTTNSPFSASWHSQLSVIFSLQRQTWAMQGWLWRVGSLCRNPWWPAWAQWGEVGFPRRCGDFMLKVESILQRWIQTNFLKAIGDPESVGYHTIFIKKEQTRKWLLKFSACLAFSQRHSMLQARLNFSFSFFPFFLHENQSDQLSLELYYAAKDSPRAALIDKCMTPLCFFTWFIHCIQIQTSQVSLNRREKRRDSNFLISSFNKMRSVIRYDL